MNKPIIDVEMLGINTLILIFIAIIATSTIVYYCYMLDKNIYYGIIYATLITVYTYYAGSAIKLLKIMKQNYQEIEKETSYKQLLNQLKKP